MPLQTAPRCFILSNNLLIPAKGDTMLSIVDFPQAYTKVHLPSKVALVVSRKPDHNYNLITVEWFMRTSIQPPQFAISIGHSRYSYDCLSDFGYFNLVLPSPELKPVLSLAGSNSGRDMDKFAASGVEFKPGKFQKIPILTEAIANFECEIVSQVRSGDHTIFVGEVKYSWLNDEKEFFVYK